MPLLVAMTMLMALLAAPGAQTPAPPAGFTALYNGRDLTGWRGGDTYDHRKWLALPDADIEAAVEGLPRHAAIIDMRTT